MPSLKPTGASIGRSSAATACVLLCKKLAQGIAASRVHSQNHIHHLHLFFWGRTVMDLMGTVPMRKGSCMFCSWELCTSYSGTCLPPSESSEATDKPWEACRWDEACRWHNLCLNLLSVEETFISTFLHLGVMTVEPVLIFNASRYYSEKICLKIINNEGLSSLSGTKSKTTSSIIQTSPPSEFKRKHTICTTPRQGLLFLVFFFFPTLTCITHWKRPARSLNPC